MISPNNEKNNEWGHAFFVNPNETRDGRSVFSKEKDGNQVTWKSHVASTVAANIGTIFQQACGIVAGSIAGVVVGAGAAVCAVTKKVVSHFRREGPLSDEKSGAGEAFCKYGSQAASKTAIVITGLVGAIPPFCIGTAAGYGISRLTEEKGALSRAHFVLNKALNKIKVESPADPKELKVRAKAFSKDEVVALINENHMLIDQIARGPEKGSLPKLLKGYLEMDGEALQIKIKQDLNLLSALFTSWDQAENFGKMLNDLANKKNLTTSMVLSSIGTFVENLEKSIESRDESRAEG